MPFAFSARLTISLCLVLGALHSGLAQNSKEPEPKAYVRLWNAQPSGGATLNLLTRKGEKKSPFQAALRWFDFAPYTPIDGETTTFLVEDAATKQTLAEVELRLEPDKYFTLVATPATKGVKVEVVDDTYSYTRGASGHATVWQFVPGVTASVVFGAEAPKVLRAGESASAEGLAPGTPIQIEVTGTNGQKMTNSYVLDCKDNNRQSFIVMQDRYQRVRTRMKYDGYVFALDPVEEPPAPASDPAAAP